MGTGLGSGGGDEGAASRSAPSGTGTEVKIASCCRRSSLTRSGCVPGRRPSAWSLRAASWAHLLDGVWNRTAKACPERRSRQAESTALRPLLRPQLLDQWTLSLSQPMSAVEAALTPSVYLPSGHCKV
ncbi:hypothetical protein CK936_17385 [Streptomyces albireticuli]|uniref:Uncharacterized protein n=1 Tax=Streptomyces albireticuli TaxID=1940 RepID=A0A2A2D5H0_9ACTN|nr:hypothetical protein CK936_17385 [Streptomyces albireticuli]